MQQIALEMGLERAVFDDFDPQFALLKANLGMWIGSALGAPDIQSRLNLLSFQLELGIRAGMISLPDRFRAVKSTGYARRLVYQDEASGVTALAMVWAPGQSTPLHDHAGLWGVEAVLSGEIESVPHRLFAEENGKYYFQALAPERLAAGTTSHLRPPFEHHITRNVSDEVAITLNIYGGSMPACNVFLPTGFGAYVRQRRALACE